MVLDKNLVPVLAYNLNHANILPIQLLLLTSNQDEMTLNRALNTALFAVFCSYLCKLLQTYYKLLPMVSLVFVKQYWKYVLVQLLTVHSHDVHIIHAKMSCPYHALNNQIEYRNE